MSKTLTPPSEKTLEKFGIRYLQGGYYAPNHYLVKHHAFAFKGFDTRSEYTARHEASLVNAIASYMDHNGKRDMEEVAIMYKSILRMLGSTSDQSK